MHFIINIILTTGNRHCKLIDIFSSFDDFKRQVTSFV